MTHDAISEHDGSTRRATSWLRRATTGPQPTTASLEAAPQVRRAPSSGVRPRARQDARHKNAEDVRALLGESTMRRILPSTGSGPPSPVLLRRAATASAHATRNPPTWFLRSSQTAQQPTKPHRVLSDIRDDDETDDSDTESVIMHDDPHRRLLPLVDETPALNAVASLLRLAGVPFSRRGDKINKIRFVPALVLGVCIPLLGGVRDHFGSGGDTRQVDPQESANRSRSQLFEWCAFASAWRLLFLSTRESPREAAFLFHPEVSLGDEPVCVDRCTTQARKQQISLVRRRMVPETVLFLVPFLLTRALATAMDAVELFLRAKRGAPVSTTNAFMEVSLLLLHAIAQTYVVFVFFTACASFRVACGVAIVQLNAFLTRFELWGDDTQLSRNDFAEDDPVSTAGNAGNTDVGDPESTQGWDDISIPIDVTLSGSSGVRGARVVHAEHERLRFFLKRMGKRFRFFLAATVALAFFETFLLALQHVQIPTTKNAAGTVPVLVRIMTSVVLSPDAVSILTRITCVVLNVRAAAIVTHRLQKVAGFASRRHADLTLEENSSLGFDPESGLSQNADLTTHTNPLRTTPHTNTWQTTTSSRNFVCRAAVLGVFRDQPLRVSVYGFTWDRDFFRGLHMVVFTTGLFVVTRALVVRGG